MSELMTVDAQRCCYSTNSILKQAPNTYQLNLTASHVDSKKGGDKYSAAISFQEGYNIIGEPYSPFNEVQCSQEGSGSVIQYLCDSRDRAMFFVTFDLSVKFLPQSNSSITVSDVYIFGDKCNDVAYCTDLAAKSESENSDKISLGPLGVWPKYAVIIGGAILGGSFLIACYFVYKRNRPDDRFKDRSITPGTNIYDNDKRLFSPNSLLRDDDLLPPSVEPPKNTLIQFGNVSAHSPERSKSVKSVHNRNQHQQSSLTKSPTKKKREDKDKDHQEVEIYDNIKSNDDHHYNNKAPNVIIEISNNNNNNENGDLEKSSHKTRRNKDKINNNVNRTSGYSISELSKTISINDNSDGGGDLSDNNNNNNNEHRHLSSTSINRKKSRSRSVNNNEEIRRGDKKSSNNDNNTNKRRSNSTSRDHESHGIDPTTSKGNYSRKNSLPQSKSTSNLQKRSSARTRKTDHNLANKNRKSFPHDEKEMEKYNKASRSDTNLSRRKSNKQKDSNSHLDTESTTSSSDIPLSDRLPLAMLANSTKSITKLPSSGQLKADDDNVEEDDDMTPLGRISSYSAGKNSLGTTSISSHTQLITSDNDNKYESVLDEILANTLSDSVADDLSIISEEKPIAYKK